MSKMKNLIKNELFKLNRRTETKVLLLFALIAVVVMNLMGYFLDNGNEKLYQREIKSMIEADEEMKRYAETVEDKIYYYSDYDMNVLKQKYPMYSAETGYITGTLEELSYEMYEAYFILGETSEDYLEAKEKYEEALKKLEHFDWQKDIREEMKANQQIIDIFEDTPDIGEATRADLEYYKEVNRVLNYRIENNIPVDGSNASNAIDNYLSNLDVYRNMDKNPTSHEGKVWLMETEESLAVTKYKLDNGLIQEDKNNNSYGTISEQMVSVMKGEGFLIGFVAVFIAAMIIPMEFDKGTIKQLLVKPYTRTEILTAKILATIIYFIEFVAIYLVMNSVVLGFFVGFSTISAPIVVYNFNTKVATQVHLVPYLLKCFLLCLPKFLVIIFVVNLFAIITKSTVSSMYIGLVLSSLDLSGFQKPFARFVVSNCWDFNIFANGRIAQNQYVTLPSSILLVVVTAVIALLLSNVLFKRKEIKNQ